MKNSEAIEFVKKLVGKKVNVKWWIDPRQSGDYHAMGKLEWLGSGRFIVRDAQGEQAFFVNLERWAEPTFSNMKPNKILVEQFDRSNDDWAWVTFETC